MTRTMVECRACVLPERYTDLGRSIGLRPTSARRAASRVHVVTYTAVCLGVLRASGLVSEHSATFTTAWWKPVRCACAPHVHTRTYATRSDVYQLASIRLEHSSVQRCTFAHYLLRAGQLWVPGLYRRWPRVHSRGELTATQQRRPLVIIQPHGHWKPRNQWRAKCAQSQ
jgi:hypothetical protein